MMTMMMIMAMMMTMMATMMTMSMMMMMVVIMMMMMMMIIIIIITNFILPKTNFRTTKSPKGLCRNKNGGNSYLSSGFNLDRWPGHCPRSNRIRRRRQRHKHGTPDSAPHCYSWKTDALERDSGRSGIGWSWRMSSGEQTLHAGLQ